MGADIQSFAEVKTHGRWIKVEEPLFSEGKTTEPFEPRNYAVFSFLADVRNYSDVECIKSLQGLPVDSDWLNTLSAYGFDLSSMSEKVIPESQRISHKEEIEMSADYHSHSWLTLQELIDFDYDQNIFNKSTNSQSTYRDLFGNNFFKDIQVLKELGNAENVRVIFWFDN